MPKYLVERTDADVQAIRQPQGRLVRHQQNAGADVVKVGFANVDPYKRDLKEASVLEQMRLVRAMVDDVVREKLLVYPLCTPSFIGSGFGISLARGVMELFLITGTAKPNVVPTMERIRVRPFCRGEPVRRVVPAPATHYFSRSATRPFRIAHVATRKSF